MMKSSKCMQKRTKCQTANKLEELPMNRCVNVRSTSDNLVQNFLGVQHGKIPPSSTSKYFHSSKGLLTGLPRRLRLHKTDSSFDRRVTAIVWHPTRSGILATGSKGGDIICWDVNRICDNMRIPGVGPGGAITSMQFHKEKPTFIYTASITGKVMLEDFEGKQSQCFLDTNTWENWYSSFDIEPEQNLLAAGDTKGYLYLQSSKDGAMVWKVPKKIHKSKIAHTEFHPLQPDILVTSSIDHTVKLWDMRKFSSAQDSLCVLQHKKGVNSANFNPSTGNLLLTTDQHSEVRVYAGPFWDAPMTIPHPHRQFQHLTPIKASWHPCMDLIVIGRYPDDAFQKCDKRCIDFFSGHTGELLFQLSNPFLPGIVSLNEFNPSGDILASGMGYQTVILKLAEEEQVLPSLDCKKQKPTRSKQSDKSPNRKSQKEKPKLKTTSKQKKVKTR